MRRGRRFVIPEAVISLISTTETPTRIGVITPKIVGNSVIRHRVARSIRHAGARFIVEHPARLDVVVKAQSGADQLSVEDWFNVLHTAAEKVEHK